jgi:hypothetical protein
MEAKHHLARWAAVRKEQRGASLCAAARHEELAVNLEAVFTLEDHLLRNHELRGREVGRQR